MSLLIISILISPVAAQEEQSFPDVLIDISKEMDVKYGNPEVQSTTLLEIFDSNSLTYEFTERDALLDQIELTNYKILIIWDPDDVYSEEELDSIYTFVDQGGVLLFAGISYANSSATVFDNINEMLSTFGITLIREMIIDITDFVGCHCGTTPVISDFEPTDYFYNISSIAASHTMRFEYEDPAYPIAWGDDDAFVDSNGNEMLDDGEFFGHIPVVIKSVYGAGTVVAFGTEKMFENAYVMREENEKFAENLFLDSVATYHQKENSSSFSYLYILPVLIVIAIAAAFIIRKR